MHEQLAHVEVHRVHVRHLQAFIFSKARLQVICQTAILFDRQNGCAFFENARGQGAETGTNLDDEIVRTHICGLDDRARYILVVKKILAERTDGRNADLLQRCLEFG